MKISQLAKKPSVKITRHLPSIQKTVGKVRVQDGASDVTAACRVYISANQHSPNYRGFSEIPGIDVEGKRKSRKRVDAEGDLRGD